MATFTITSETMGGCMSKIIQLVDSSQVNGSTIFFSVVGSYLAYIIAYGLFFCPTRHIPGPLITGFTGKYFHYLFFGGSMSTIILEQHKKYGCTSFSVILISGPVLRLAPDRIDVQLPGIDQEAWGGHNETKFPWNKEAAFCKGVKCGLDVENVVSIPGGREALRMRRLMGSPFARKFLLDQEDVFKRCVERVLQNIDRLS